MFVAPRGSLRPKDETQSDTKKVLHGVVEDSLLRARPTLFVINSPYPILGGTFGSAYAYVVRYL